MTNLLSTGLVANSKPGYLYFGSAHIYVQADETHPI